MIFFFQSCTGPDGVLSLLRYLERRMLGRTTELSTTPKKLSRASSRNELSGMNRDLLEMILDDKTENQASGRRRTFSQGSYKKYSRTHSINASQEGSPLNLRRKTTLNQALQKHSREEDVTTTTASVPTSPTTFSPPSRSISLDSSEESKNSS